MGRNTLPPITMLQSGIKELTSSSYSYLDDLLGMAVVEELVNITSSLTSSQASKTILK